MKRLSTCWVLWLPVLLVITTSCSTNKEDDRKLAVKGEKGEEYTFSLMQAAQQKWAENISVDTIILNGTFRIIKRTDSLTLIRFTFARLSVITPVQKISSSKQMTGRIRIGPEMIFRERDLLLGSLPGMSMLLTLNQKGHVEQVEEIDNITDSLSALNMLNNFSVASLLHDYLSNDAMKDIFNAVFYLLPGREVKTGDRWVNDFTLTTKAPVKMSNACMMEYLQEDTAGIRIQSVISATTGEGGRTYLKGKKEGFAKISLKTGFPYEYQTSSESVTTTDYYEVNRRQMLIVSVR